MPVKEMSVGGYGHNPAGLGVPQRVFGELLALALPVTKEYLSDLYHDAIWLRDHLPDSPQEGAKPLTFWFIVREWGTHLSQDKRWADAVIESWPDSFVYSCAVVNDRGAWRLLVSVKEA